MTPPPDESSEPTRLRYRVTETEPAEAEREAAYLRLARLLDPDYAFRWYEDLRRAIEDLAGFPGPLSHARDEEASAFYGYEVRRMLYFGPGNRRLGTPYRVLFTILPFAPDEDEAVIRVLRVLHGAQRLAEPQNEAGEDGR